jgi:hypothetical protein
LEAVARVASRLVVQAEPIGDDEGAKLRRAAIRTARLQPLYVEPGTGLSEALQAVTPLAPSATEQEKVQRASDLMAAYASAGYRGIDE